jgi:predicted AAA+ superfamily ATPase
LNWDNDDDRLAILDGPAAVNSRIGLTPAGTIIFDELHKYPHWKNFLKGFYDSYGNKKLNVVVTGSARLDVYRKGADSLMGRYFSYRMHPLSVGEIASPGLPPQEISLPSEITDKDFAGLLRFGGFPEPFLKKTTVSIPGGSECGFNFYSGKNCVTSQRFMRLVRWKSWPNSSNGKPANW